LASVRKGQCRIGQEALRNPHGGGEDSAVFGAETGRLWFDRRGPILPDLGRGTRPRLGDPDADGAGITGVDVGCGR
jgi:hypothetical protein